ncbi:MAG: twin-arginine translocase subunit TatC [Planctomycetota bacterium]|jgi:Tat protein translocase TatC
MSDPKAGLDPNARRMTVGEHLDELRKRVLRCIVFLALALVVCLVFNRHIMGWIVSQPYEVLRELGHDRPAIQALSPTEGFVTWLKVALVAALVLASPLMVRELWKFVSAGLYPKERKYIEIFAPLSYVLFLGGIAFLYFVILPVALRFLYSFGMDPIVPGVEGQVVVVAPRYAAYVSFYITMCLIMGVVFQLPLVMLFFMATGILSPAFFSKYRRHFVVGAVVVLAVLTPTGDAATLLLVCLPVLLLYEGGLLLGRILLRRRSE